ncbi:hypothetical protein HDU85_004068 [Gaertneriomyces sp. JEL0708]|nr:hypothetical protein HDU85_004068 [Gaertneriomyces sp. JEL0708]
MSIFTDIPLGVAIPESSPPSPSFYLIPNIDPQPSSSKYHPILSQLRQCTMREQKGHHPLFPNGVHYVDMPTSASEWSAWNQVLTDQGVHAGNVLCGVGLGCAVVLRWLETHKAAGVVLINPYIPSVSEDGSKRTEFDVTGLFDHSFD